MNEIAAAAAEKAVAGGIGHFKRYCILKCISVESVRLGTAASNLRRTARSCVVLRMAEGLDGSDGTPRPNDFRIFWHTPKDAKYILVLVMRP